jgi:hypothetical protein
MRKHEDRSRDGEARAGRGMRQLIALLALAFVVTLGVVVGTRMSSDAIAVLVGVIAGVAASIPCALLLLVVTRRREPEEDAPYNGTRYDEGRYRQAPPVIVVTPGGASPQQLPYGLGYGYPAPYGEAPPGLSAGRRQFRVMGYDEEEDEATPIDGEVEAVSWHR